MRTDFYYLKVNSDVAFNYLFKKPADERLLIDPDLELAYDVAYQADDAQEVLARALTREEAHAARQILVNASSSPGIQQEEVELVPIDPLNPLASFADEQMLLRSLKCFGDPMDEVLKGFSYARASTRADGIRTEGRLFYRRSLEPEAAQECYEVEAVRLNPPARVVARYGRWLHNTTGPRARTERFKFVEWEAFQDIDMETLLVGACRVLQAQEAQAIASYLRNSADFSDVRITKGTLRQLDASEGMCVTADQPFAQAGAALEAEVGFPFFLCVFPLDEGDRLIEGK